MTAEKISRQYVNLSKIKSNPNNPRIIKDDAFVGGFEKFAEWGLV